MTAHTQQALSDLSSYVKWLGQMPQGLPTSLVNALSDEIRRRKGILNIGLAVDKRSAK